MTDTDSQKNDEIQLSIKQWIQPPVKWSDAVMCYPVHNDMCDSNTMQEYFKISVRKARNSVGEIALQKRIYTA